MITIFVLSYALAEHLFLLLLWWVWHTREHDLRRRERALHEREQRFRRRKEGHSAMTEQHVTLNDIEQAATQLGMTFVGGDTWFDLDTRPDAPFGLNGTYQNSTAGIEAAYGDLVRYRDRNGKEIQP